MLDEMGVKVWWPMRTLAGAGTDVDALPVAPRTPPPVPPPSPSASAPAPAPARPAATPPAAAGNAAFVLLEPAQRLYDDTEANANANANAGAGVAQGGWLVVVDMPPGADGRHGPPFAGDAGRLLQNMLRALRLDRSPAPVHLARVHRGAPGSSAGRRLDDGFAAQAAALAPRMVLALGPLAAQGLLASAEPLGKLRGRVAAAVQLPGVAVVASYHPAYLLRNPADKAKAWADLCLAAAEFERRVS